MQAATRGFREVTRQVGMAVSVIDPSPENCRYFTQARVLGMSHGEASKEALADSVDEGLPGERPDDSNVPCMV